MSRGRTSWFAQDAAWLRRELVVELGEEHGPPAVSVLIALRGMAQEQRHPDGEVLTGYRTLAREAFVDVDQARALVEAANGIGVLDDLEMLEDGKRFTCRVSGWRADQEKGRAAFRQAKKRAHDADPEPDSAQEPGNGPVTPHEQRDAVTPGVTGSRDVTEKPPPDITEPNKEPPVVPQGGRDRDRAKFDQEVRAFAADLLPTADIEMAFAAVDQAIRAQSNRARPASRGDIVDHIQQWFPDLVPDLTAERVAA